MQERVFGRKQVSKPNSSHQSLVLPNTPTLANSTKSFGLPSHNIVQTATEESATLQTVPSVEGQTLSSPAIAPKFFSHDFSRIPLHRPQTKLTVGEPDDQYEQEADNMADRVMRMVLPNQLNASIIQPPQNSLQRKCAACEEKEKLQTKPSTLSAKYAGLEAENNLESRLNSSKGGGSPLSHEVRSFMEPRFNADFSGVRVHTGSDATQMNRELSAQAFTHHKDIYFGAGKSPSNDALTAHELTHVVQQSPEIGNQLAYNQQSTQQIQRATGDGHDLSSPRFAGDAILEDIYDGTTTLKQGDENDAVRKVQHAIHDAGILFMIHGVDGKFGRETERLVTQFQARHRITTDPRGEVGAATIAKLDQLFPALALPSTSGDPYTFAGMLEILCQWNSAMIRDLRNLRVEMVGGLEWADEEFDGTNWVPRPMPGAGETSGTSIIIATNGSNEEVAKALYHEYQHARTPSVYRLGNWSDEESRVYTMETNWSIDRGMTPDPNLTTTDPVTGEVTADTTGIQSTVESYPGLDAANPGEVIAKVGTNRVRVRMPNGRITVRNAVAGDSIPGPRHIIPPRHVVRDREWRC
ncbi:DUF4157 domain-containing protein [Tolypothrix sp. FACHB-123]|uniref:eCIS core domain-containing protein n=1 Tax=Tolypothrix sp. FACHB-123 TaxID=2692868 RepID=UPI001686496A|nr:DUF4157 domain-containing protein [Tolypothrix sp. FACHB-123]MBD2355181.1 DUF4157 domain-containing protein [Tolypothrix sp. FACHB-123]